jgi:hypothetical protein
MPQSELNERCERIRWYWRRIPRNRKPHCRPPVWKRLQGRRVAVDKAGDKQAADLSLRCASDMLCLSPS